MYTNPSVLFIYIFLLLIKKKSNFYYLYVPCAIECLDHRKRNVDYGASSGICFLVFFLLYGTYAFFLY